MNTVFAPQPQAVIPVAGSDAVFPVHRIYCVGQNYSAHVREMGKDPAKTQPVFFSKPADAVVTHDAPIIYPMATENLHYEVELVVGLKAGGKRITAQEAESLIYGFGVGIDFTRRDLQAQYKAKGQPWDVAKGFDFSAPLSSLKPVEYCQDVNKSRIWLSVDDVMKQDANTEDMIWSVPSIIAELSNYFELKAGDIIFTGTPSGVDSVVSGNCIRAGVEGVGELEVSIVEGN